MKSYYLRFSDKALAYKTLSNYVRNGRLCSTRDFVVDELGVLVRINDDVITTIDGYHVNVLTNSIDGLQDYIIEPQTPDRVWA